MDEFNFKAHPHELFEQWYLYSQGKAKNQNLSSQLKMKWQTALKTMFTKAVPSLDRMNHNAFVLATSGKDGKPSSRVVLLKESSSNGYVFYTNYNSEKSRHIQENPVASLNFFWAYPTRQVRIVGHVEKVSRMQSENYWASRPRGSQEGALASEQSSELKSYKTLTEQLNQVQLKYKDQKIPCPAHWGGFIVIPRSYEFWVAMPNRLHKRVKVELNTNGGWDKTLLSP